MKKTSYGMSLAALAMFSTQAFAVAPTTLAELTTGISFTDVGLGVLAVGGILITYYLLKKGAREVIHTVKSM